MAGVEAVEGFQAGFVGEVVDVGFVGVSMALGDPIVEEAVLVGPEEFLVAGGDEELIAGGAKDGVLDVDGVAVGAVVEEGLVMGSQRVEAGVEAVAAGVLRDTAFAFGRVGAGGFAGIGAVGGESAFAPLS